MNQNRNIFIFIMAILDNEGTKIIDTDSSVIIST